MSDNPFGRALAQARGPLLQAETAERLGVSQAYLSRLETGRLFPSLRRLHQFCNALAVSGEVRSNLESLWRARELAGMSPSAAEAAMPPETPHPAVTRGPAPVLIEPDAGDFGDRLCKARRMAREHALPASRLHVHPGRVVIWVPHPVFARKWPDHLRPARIQLDDDVIVQAFGAPCDDEEPR